MERSTSGNKRFNWKYRIYVLFFFYEKKLKLNFFFIRNFVPNKFFKIFFEIFFQNKYMLMYRLIGKSKNDNVENTIQSHVEMKHQQIPENDKNDDDDDYNKNENDDYKNENN